MNLPSKGSPVPAGIMVLAVLAVLWSAHFAYAFLAPLTFAVFLLALIWPIYAALEKRVFPTVAAIVTLIGVIALLVILGSIVAMAFGTIWRTIIGSAARYQALYQSAADWLEARGIVLAGVWADAVDVNWLLRVGQQLMSRTSSAATFWVVVVAYLVTGLVEMNHLKGNIAGAGSTQRTESIVAACAATARKFRLYFLVRSIISLATGAAVAVVALATGVPFAKEWGIIAFVLNYIPFIGPLISTVLPSLFAFAHLGDPRLALFLFGFLFLVQFVGGNYLEPRVAGNALRLSPFFILVSIFLWTFIWGIYGTFIGVPIALAVSSFALNAQSAGWLAAILGAADPRATAGSQPRRAEEG